MSQNINNKCFLQALQIHIFQYGICQKIVSDNESPIVSSIGQISEYLSDPVVKNFLQEKNILTLEFMPYPAGASFLGGIVESLVKQVKHMVYASISKNILPFDEFNFLVQECCMLINKRPIAYSSMLRDPANEDDSLGVITPELLIRGYDVPCISVIPQLDCEIADSFGRADQGSLYEALSKLRTVKSRLNEIYHNEFIHNLRESSVNRPGRYKSMSHLKLCIGDLVVLRQQFTKPYMYPMGIVTAVESNNLDEVVSVSMRKSNGEIIRRHVSDVILLEAGQSADSEGVAAGQGDAEVPPHPVRKVARKAAASSALKIRDLYLSNVV
jgi:hypothetical protein